MITMLSNFLRYRTTLDISEVTLSENEAAYKGCAKRCTRFRMKIADLYPDLQAVTCSTGFRCKLARAPQAERRYDPAYWFVEPRCNGYKTANQVEQLMDLLHKGNP